MKTWGVELTARGKSSAGSKIQRGIFQGDALSPLLFVTAMIPKPITVTPCVLPDNSE